MYNISSQHMKSLLQRASNMKIIFQVFDLMEIHIESDCYYAVSMNVL